MFLNEVFSVSKKTKADVFVDTVFKCFGGIY